MRTLTSIQSADTVLADLEFHLTASDQSTTWIFGRNDIRAMSNINWEVPFMGGVGKTSNYKITLNSSSGWVRDYLYKTVKGEAFLKVFVNSDNFTPHAGRVRGVNRDGFDPNKIQLTVFDRFLDAVPHIPIASIVDSYSTPHPDVIASDMGYPLYYGKHTRPFYMTPVDCDISLLLGPRDVSSANHVTSLWFNTDLAKSLNGVSDHIISVKGSWNQQSGSTNLTNPSSYFFNLVGEGIFEFNKSGYNITNELDSDNVFQILQGQYCKTQCAKTKTSNNYINAITLKSKFTQNIRQTTNLSMSMNFDVNSIVFGTINTFVDSGPSSSQYTLVTSEISPNLMVFSGDVSSTNAKYLLTNDSTGLRASILFNTTSLIISAITSLDLSVQLYSDSYKNYSIFGTQVNCSEIAISENPVAILQDIIDQTSYSYITEQASQGQVDTSSYNLQCFLGERQELSNILDEFGRISVQYLWIGDSGHINMNTYQDSTAGIEDFTLCMSDFLSLSIKDNPLGTTSFETSKAKRIKLDYAYNHQTGQYENTLIADPNNTAACNSLYAAGVDKELGFQTKYIMETETASLYLGNLINKLTKEDVIIRGSLPARFFEIEIADILKVAHPTFQNSVSLFQVTNLSPNYLKGNINITAYQL